MSMKLDLEVSKFEKELLKFVKSQMLLYFDDNSSTSAFTESVWNALETQIEYAYQENSNEFGSLDSTLGFLLTELDVIENFREDIDFPNRNASSKMIATPLQEDFNHFKEITEQYGYSMNPEDCVKAEFEIIFDDIKEFIMKY